MQIRSLFLSLRFFVVFILFQVDFAFQHRSLFSISQNQVSQTHEKQESIRYHADWQGTRKWIGPHWWASPIHDWYLKNNSVIAAASESRTLSLIPVEAHSNGLSLQIHVTIKLIRSPSKKTGQIPSSVAAGFLFGRRGTTDDYRSHAVRAFDYTEALILRSGHLKLGPKQSKDSVELSSIPIKLKLYMERVGTLVLISLQAIQSKKRVTVKWTTFLKVIQGGVSLFTNGNVRSKYIESPPFKIAFSSFSILGDLVSYKKDRSFGPIMWTQYALQRHCLKIQAQLAPLDGFPNVYLHVRHGNKWIRRAKSSVDRLSRTALFTIWNWNALKRTRYRVKMFWGSKAYFWYGVIREEPQIEKPFRLGVFSCDLGYTFPLRTMVSQVSRQNPDMLYFAGDQIYEYWNGPAQRFQNLNVSMLDFLQKFYLFGWTWRKLLANRPSIIIPDDHDVFQGNLFGNGGVALPNPKALQWTAGGYIMPKRWINAVEKCYVGHLPDPAVNKILPLGIRPYFTSLVYANISFAILEDRKFKTGPLRIPAESRLYGGIGDLLGADQETFLRDWASKWPYHSMKVALSQTIFSAGATHSGLDLERARFCTDSGGWPIDARNRVIKILKDANALSIHGDQHFGILLKQGIERFGDGGYSFMVPGTANGFPRAWWPGVSSNLPPKGKKFTGRYYDDGGYPQEVLAVANPERGSNSLDVYGANSIFVAYKRGSGYGLVKFNRKSRSATFNMYRHSYKPEQFDGFPKRIYIGGKKFYD